MKRPVELRRTKTLVYANALGAVLMFASWVSQNVYQSEMSSEMSSIDKGAQFVSSEMSKALTWMLTFQTEHRKPKPDPEVILNSALGYAETTGLIVQAASRIDPDSAVLKKHVADHQKLMRPLRSAAERRDLKEIEEAVSVMMMWFGAIDREAREAVNRRAQSVGDAEAKFKRLFLVVFGLGSLVYAWTWWKTNEDVLKRRRRV